MPKFILLFLLSTVCFAQNRLNVMSFNIRYATPNDGINQWENRKHLVGETISFFETDLLGLQEATLPQVKYLADQLATMKWIGVGRDDGAEKGEFSPIFYNSSRLVLKDWSTIWLSETPEKPSKNWDAALPRIATIAHFKTLKGKKEFICINTHFDHIGVKARHESAKILAQRVKEFRQKGMKVILMGDFNCNPDEDPILALTNSELKLSENVSKTPHFGPIDTFNGFEAKERERTNIDHILVTAGITVWKHASISQTWQGRFASDHYAVMAQVSF